MTCSIVYVENARGKRRPVYSCEHDDPMHDLKINAAMITQMMKADAEGRVSPLIHLFSTTETVPVPPPVEPKMIKDPVKGGMLGVTKKSREDS